MVEVPSLPPMLVASVYLRTRDGGASEYTLEILSYTGSMLSEHRMPWLIGDFQLSPAEVAETMFPTSARGRILADFNPMGTLTHAKVYRS